MKQSLPANFLWGNSVSSMQTEGAWDEGGKGMSVYDIREAGENISDWKVATDSYHRYREDFDLMQDLGMNCYRFQISWSRVCPQGDGAFNDEGIAFYDRFIDDLIARGIEPMICLYHFDMPLALAQEYNGFNDRRVMEAFIRYGKKMIDCFGDRVKYWLTFNEQNIFHMPIAFRISGYMKGEETLRELYELQHHTMVAHMALTDYLHQTKPGQLMGGMLAHQLIYRPPVNRATSSAPSSTTNPQPEPAARLCRSGLQPGGDGRCGAGRFWRYLPRRGSVAVRPHQKRLYGL